MADGEIEVDGLKAFSKKLKAVDSDLAKQLRVVANEAGEIVAEEARNRVPRGKTGHAASSIKMASTRTAARVAGGSSRAPYYAWLDYGGRTGINDSAKRPYRRKGRYVWSAYSDLSDEVYQRLNTGIVQLARDAGFEVD